MDNESFAKRFALGTWWSIKILFWSIVLVGLFFWFTIKHAVLALFAKGESSGSKS